MNQSPNRIRSGYAAIQPSTRMVAIAAALMGYAGIALGGGTHVQESELTLVELIAFDDDQLDQGRKIVDIEMRADGSLLRCAGVWGEVPGAAVHGIVGVGSTDWQDFVDDMTALDGRWLDVEVTYVAGQKLWAGIFVEDGDNYVSEVRTTMTEADLEQRLGNNFRSGRQVIDFEAYTEGTNTRYAAVWTDDPNQPRTVLYYHLTASQVNDLLNPQFPIDPSTGLTPLPGTPGKVIDVERYYSSLHSETRYAIIFSNHESSEQWVKTGDLDELEADNASLADNDTQLVDLDVYEENGVLRYLGVWSHEVKSLNEVAAIPADPDPQPISAALQSWIDAYEASEPGMIGFYAKNIRTNQSIAYNADRPFYLASTSKVPMHMLLWKLDEDPNIDLDITTDTMAYSTNVNNGNPWYVDNRDNINNPASDALGPNDFGQTFGLDDLDQFMLQQSDNAATSMLFEMQIGRRTMNDWLASLDGIGRGFHPITGITDLDRVIMWQGQVNAFPNATSYWFIPSWVWEPLLRQGFDQFGWLQAYVGLGNPLPQFNQTIGHQRYYNMGLNSAEPRAFVLLQEKLAEGQILSTPQNTAACISQLGTGSPLDDVIDGVVNIPGMPPALAAERPGVWAKNGGKGNTFDGTRVINDTAFFTKGPDTIVVGLFSQGNTLAPATFRATYTPPIGYLLYSGLISDLKDRGLAYHKVSDLTVQQGQTWWIHVDVMNDRPGDATPYKVSFYASTNATIEPALDTLIGTYQTPVNHPGNQPATVGLDLLDFPAITPGEYYVGWVIDAQNEVGEWNDSDNTVMLRDTSGALRKLRVSEGPTGPINSITKPPTTPTPGLGRTG